MDPRSDKKQAESLKKNSLLKKTESLKKQVYIVKTNTMASGDFKILVENSQNNILKCTTL